jgi:hypothetical protein
MFRNRLTLARVSAIALLPTAVCISACSRFESHTVADPRFHQGSASDRDDPRCRVAYCAAKDDIYNRAIFYDP